MAESVKPLPFVKSLIGWGNASLSFGSRDLATPSLTFSTSVSVLETFSPEVFLHIFSKDL